MRRLPASILVVCAALSLAACGPSSPSAGGTAAAPTGSTSAICAEVTDIPASTVAATIKEFKFAPEPVTAKLDEVIVWTNNDSTAHTASLTDGSCGTKNIGGGAQGALVFHAPGTYPYQCNIHSSMKGSIVIE
jgi:plastocyanin